MHADLVLGLIAAGTAAIACTPGAETSSDPPAPAPELAMNLDQPADGVANLPYARGKTFRTLDDYLAHLEQQGAIDLPWWREISPGIYEHVVRMPGARREIATRAELMERFGFTR